MKHKPNINQSFNVSLNFDEQKISERYEVTSRSGDVLLKGESIQHIIRHKRSYLLVALEAFAEHRWEDVAHLLPFLMLQSSTVPMDMLWRLITVAIKNSSVLSSLENEAYTRFIELKATKYEILLALICEQLPEINHENIPEFAEKIDQLFGSAEAGRETRDQSYMERYKSYIDRCRFIVFGYLGLSLYFHYKEEFKEDYDTAYKTGSRVSEKVSTVALQRMEKVLNYFNWALQSFSEPCEWMMESYIDAVHIVNGQKTAVDEIKNYVKKFPLHLPGHRLAFKLLQKFPNSQELQKKELEEIVRLCPDDPLVLTYVELQLKKGAEIEKLFKFITLIMDMLEYKEWQYNIRPWEMLSKLLKYVTDQKMNESEWTEMSSKLKCLYGERDSLWQRYIWFVPKYTEMTINEANVHLHKARVAAILCCDHQYLGLVEKELKIHGYKIVDNGKQVQKVGTPMKSHKVQTKNSFKTENTTPFLERICPLDLLSSDNINCGQSLVKTPVHHQRTKKVSSTLKMKGTLLKETPAKMKNKVGNKGVKNLNLSFNEDSFVASTQGNEKNQVLNAGKEDIPVYDSGSDSAHEIPCGQKESVSYEADRKEPNKNKDDYSWFIDSQSESLLDLFNPLQVNVKELIDTNRNSKENTTEVSDSESVVAASEITDLNLNPRCLKSPISKECVKLSSNTTADSSNSSCQSDVTLSLVNLSGTSNISDCDPLSAICSATYVVSEGHSKDSCDNFEVIADSEKQSDNIDCIPLTLESTSSLTDFVSELNSKKSSIKNDHFKGQAGSKHNMSYQSSTVAHERDTVKVKCEMENLTPKKKKIKESQLDPKIIDNLSLCNSPQKTKELNSNLEKPTPRKEKAKEFQFTPRTDNVSLPNASHIAKEVNIKMEKFTPDKNRSEESQLDSKTDNVSLRHASCNAKEEKSAKGHKRKLSLSSGVNVKHEKILEKSKNSEFFIDLNHQTVENEEIMKEVKNGKCDYISHVKDHHSKQIQEELPNSTHRGVKRKRELTETDRQCNKKKSKSTKLFKRSSDDCSFNEMASETELHGSVNLDTGCNSTSGVARRKKEKSKKENLYTPKRPLSDCGKKMLVYESDDLPFPVFYSQVLENSFGNSQGTAEGCLDISSIQAESETMCNVDVRGVDATSDEMNVKQKEVKSEKLEMLSTTTVNTFKKCKGKSPKVPLESYGQSKDGRREIVCGMKAMSLPSGRVTLKESSSSRSTQESVGVCSAVGIASRCDEPFKELSSITKHKLKKSRKQLTQVEDEEMDVKKKELLSSLEKEKKSIKKKKKNNLEVHEDTSVTSQVNQNKAATSGEVDSSLSKNKNKKKKYENYPGINQSKTLSEVDPDRAAVNKIDFSQAKKKKSMKKNKVNYPVINEQMTASSEVDQDKITTSDKIDSSQHRKKSKKEKKVKYPGVNQQTTVSSEVDGNTVTASDKIVSTHHRKKSKKEKKASCPGINQQTTVISEVYGNTVTVSDKIDSTHHRKKSEKEKKVSCPGMNQQMTVSSEVDQDPFITSHKIDSSQRKKKKKGSCPGINQQMTGSFEDEQDTAMISNKVDSPQHKKKCMKKKGVNYLGINQQMTVSSEVDRDTATTLDKIHSSQRKKKKEVCSLGINQQITASSEVYQDTTTTLDKIDSSQRKKKKYIKKKEVCSGINQQITASFEVDRYMATSLDKVDASQLKKSKKEKKKNYPVNDHQAIVSFEVDRGTIITTDEVDILQHKKNSKKKKRKCFSEMGEDTTVTSDLKKRHKFFSTSEEQKQKKLFK